jgi:hypothetical protein
MGLIGPVDKMEAMLGSYGPNPAGEVYTKVVSPLGSSYLTNLVCLRREPFGYACQVRHVYRAVQSH